MLVKAAQPRDRAREEPMSTPVSTTPPDVTTPIGRPTPLVGRTFGEPRFHTDGDVAAVAFAADDTLFSVDEAGVLRHWAADGRLLRRAYLSDLETLWCFSPDAKRLASGNDDLLFWDVAAGTLVNRVAQPAWVTALAFSADGRVLASGHDDGTVRFWDAATQQPLGQIRAHPAAVSAIAFAPAGDRVATAGEDRAVCVWDVASHKKLADLVSHTDRIPALSWKADGSLLVSAGWDTSARVWDLSGPDPLMLLNSHSDQVVAAAFGPAGLLATADSDNEVRLWSDPATGTVAHVLHGHDAEVRALAFSPSGSRLASAGADRVIHVWDTATGKLVGGPSPTGRHSVAVLPAAGGGLRLASTGGPSFRLWDVATGAELPPTGDGPAYSVAGGPDGRWLVVGGTDHFTRLYDLTGGTPARRLEATKPPIGAVAVSPTGNYVSHTSPADGLVWLWNLATGDPDLILIEAADGCTLEGLAFLPDGERLAVGGIDYLSTGERTGAVCVWHLPSKEKRTVFDVGVYAVAADPSGRYLAGAGMDDTVYLWDLSTEEEVFALSGHGERINAVAFSPDGSYLVSGSDDQTVRVWDVLSGRLLVAREFDSPIQGLAFSPDGRWLFTANGNTTCHQVAVTRLLED
jgi:WD40 repeat protein